MVIRRYLDWRTRTARPPQALGMRAARMGAAAVVVAILVAAVPVAQGWRADAPPQGASAWAEMQRAGYAARLASE